MLHCFLGIQVRASLRLFSGLFAASTGILLLAADAYQRTQLTTQPPPSLRDQSNKCLTFQVGILPLRR